MMRNGDATLELPFGVDRKSEMQSPPMGAVVSRDRGARFLSRPAGPAQETRWVSLPRHRVELVAVVDGVEFRSGACRYHTEALAKVQRLRKRSAEGVCDAKAAG